MGIGGAGGPPGREWRGSSIGRGLQAAVVSMFGGVETILTMLRKEIQERATPGAYASSLEDGWGGVVAGESEAATRCRSRSRALSHTSVDPIKVLAQNLDKLPTPGTSTLLYHPHHLGSSDSRPRPLALST